MKRDQVQIGKVYAVKVSGRIVPVKIVEDSSLGGWSGMNLNTGHIIRIKTAAKLRYGLSEEIPGRWTRV